MMLNSWRIIKKCGVDKYLANKDDISCICGLLTSEFDIDFIMNILEKYSNIPTIKILDKANFNKQTYIFYKRVLVDITKNSILKILIDLFKFHFETGYYIDPYFDLHLYLNKDDPQFCYNKFYVNPLNLRKTVFIPDYYMISVHNTIKLFPKWWSSNEIENAQYKAFNIKDKREECYKLIIEEIEKVKYTIPDDMGNLGVIASRN